MPNFTLHIVTGKRKLLDTGGAGFTLIELIVVFSVMAILASISIVSFSTYNNSQTFQNAVSDVQTLLLTAKSRTLSQVKTSQCANQGLNGYQVSLTAPGSAYELDVICDGQSYPIDKKSLPPQTTFASGSISQIVFSIPQGTVANTGNIVIHGFGLVKTISIDALGNITVF